MHDEAFIRWLRDQAKKADDAAHDLKATDWDRDQAWGRHAAYTAVLEKLGRLEE